MPTGYDWTSYQAAVVTQIPTVVTDPNFVVMLPNSIDYAELSIYRDLDLLTMKGNLPLGTTTAGVSTIATPPSVVAIETVTATAASLGSAAILTPTSQDYILAVYLNAPEGIPQYFAVTGAQTTAGDVSVHGLQLLLGPTPDFGYLITAYCSQRDAPLSETNPTTFIWTQFPDLAWAAAMIYWSGYAKNFGAQADDPRMAVSWTAEYQRILKGAQVEQARLRFQATGWQAQPPTPLAQPRT